MKGTYPKGVHRFCILVSASTFFLVIAGGMVTSTDSGLAVPDWPLSYGQVMPPMVGGIFYEHGHRMVATFVGFLTIIMAIWLWRTETRKWLRNLGVIALLLVIAQGVLGGITVLYLLPVAISVSHATLAQSFFVLIVLITLASSRWWCEGEMAPPVQSSTRTLPILVFAAVFIQLILGALMRHTDSGLAVPDFPLAFGSLWPSMDSGSLNEMNDHRAGMDLMPVSAGQVAIHMLHRLWAVVVSSLVVILAIRTFRDPQSRFREPVLLLTLLVLFQILLGALTIWSGKNAAVTTAHVATGSLILACSAGIVMAMFRRVMEGPSHMVKTDLIAERGIA